MVRLGWLGTLVRTQHDDHEDVVGRGEIDLVHDQRLVVTEGRLSVDVGLRRRFGASLVVPIRLTATTIRYLDTAGAEVELTRPGIHHRDETVAGLADPMVLGSVAGALGGLRLTARAGVTLPLGRTEPDPFALGDLGLPHQHLQLGTGTVNPVLAVEVARRWGPWRVGGFGYTQQVVYANGEGYQAGDRYAGGVSARRQLGAAWGGRGGVEVQAERAERWHGVVPTDDGNRGRFDLLLAAGASWAATPQLSVDLGVKVPVVTRVVGGQLAMPAIVELGASWSFGGPRAKHAHDEEDHDHDHDHDHGDHGDHDDHDDHGDHDDHDDHDDAGHAGAEPAAPDLTGLDVVDLAPAGAAVELIPVAGKVTVFDFWAPWCEPCKLLEPELIALARAHPDRIAIRRVDVVDWDSAAVARYLTPGGFDLPHVKVVDAAGRQVLERSSTGDLPGLIDAIRTVVAPPAATPPAATPPAAVPPATTAPAAIPLTGAPRSAPSAPTPSPPKARARRVRIVVTALGFEPSNVTVPKGQPVTLVFERQTARTCATEVVFQVAGATIERALPLNQPVALTVTFPQAGPITYHCAMDMIRGTITVR